MSEDRKSRPTARGARSIAIVVVALTVACLVVWLALQLVAIRSNLTGLALAGGLLVMGVAAVNVVLFVVDEWMDRRSTEKDPPARHERGADDGNR